MQEYVAALTRVESNFVKRIKESSKLDATYQKLVQDVTAGIVHHYWLEDGLLVVSYLFLVEIFVESY